MLSNEVQVYLVLLTHHILRGLYYLGGGPVKHALQRIHLVGLLYHGKFILLVGLGLLRIDHPLMGGENDRIQGVFLDLFDLDEIALQVQSLLVFSLIGSL